MSIKSFLEKICCESSLKDLLRALNVSDLVYSLSAAAIKCSVTSAEAPCIGWYVIYLMILLNYLRKIYRQIIITLQKIDSFAMN